MAGKEQSKRKTRKLYVTYVEKSLLEEVSQLQSTQEEVEPRSEHITTSC